MTRLPTLQFVDRPSIIDLGWGHPDPDLLPTELVQRACVTAIARHGSEALQYGHCGGPAPLVEWLLERIEVQEARRPAVDEIMITAGASVGLDLVLSASVQPGDSVFVESPTYHLSVRILQDHGLHLIPITSDDEGIVVNELAARIAQTRGLAKRPRLLYTVPTFNNPRGTSLSDARRHALVELAAREGLTLIEDDVYRALAYDAPPPSSLWSLAPPGTVARLASFSKSLAPGLRLGWLTAGGDLVHRITGSGLLDSGGGLNHFTAMAVATLCEAGEFDAHVAHLLTEYRARRDALLASLERHLPQGCSFDVPHGGYFAWLVLPPGYSSEALLPHAEAAGTSFLPGSRFHLDGRSDGKLRLSFSRYSPDLLAEAGQRLGRAVKSLMASAGSAVA